jgi:membrane fusion protein (multidrug efflux system)
VDAAKQKKVAAGAQIEASEASVKSAEAELNRAKAAVDNANLQLSYTTIAAPIAGKVTNRHVWVGDYVQIGQPLVSIVPNEVYVTANFKETQLTYMQVGQPVRIHIDAYPQDDFPGHVDSIQSGSGAAFSLLPAENATGNYVKVVQRMPVKIVFDHPVNRPLTPGMSVEPRVRVR